MRLQIWRFQTNRIRYIEGRTDQISRSPGECTRSTSRFVSGELGRHSEFLNDGVCDISRSRSFPWCICRRRELVRRSRLGALQVRNCAIADYVIAHIDEPIEVSTLEDSGAQPVPFTRLLTRFVGVSPHRYVVHLRWQRAVELVRHVRSGLADVAVRTGLADQSHLTRWVRRVHGVSLTELVA